MRTEAQTRAQVRDAKRIVVKVGSSSLTTVQSGLDRDRVRRIAHVLGAQRAAGREIVLVSSGAVSAGWDAWRNIANWASIFWWTTRSSAASPSMVSGLSM